MQIDKAIDKLNAAYKRLDEPQGRIARRNARNAFMVALKALRRGLEDEYPLQRKPITRRRKPDPVRTVRGKEKIGPNAHRELLASGISPGTFTVRGKDGDVVYAPTWMKRAYERGVDRKLIRQAVRSQPKRRRILAMLRLGMGTKTP